MSKSTKVTVLLIICLSIIALAAPKNTIAPLSLRMASFAPVSAPTVTPTPTSTIIFPPTPTPTPTLPRLSSTFKWLAIVLIAFISLILNVFLGIRLLQVQRHKSPEYNYPEAASEMVKLFQGRDPLSSLAMFLYWADQKKATVADARASIELLLDELYKWWGVEMFGEINKTVRFDPTLHRSYAQLKPGRKVRVVKPGWKLGGKIIKYPVVLPEDNAEEVQDE